MLVQGGRPADGVPWFEKALTRSPDFVEAQLNLGIALQQAGQSNARRRSTGRCSARRETPSTGAAGACELALLQGTCDGGRVGPAVSGTPAVSTILRGLKARDIGCQGPACGRPARACAGQRHEPAARQGPPVLPSTDRHDARRPRRRVRLRRRADARDVDRLAREACGSIAPTRRRRSPDVARQPADRPLPARPWRAPQRRRGVATCRRSPRRCATRALRPARSSPRSRSIAASASRAASTSTATACRGAQRAAANERPARARGGRGPRVASSERRLRRRPLLPLGAPLRAARALRRPAPATATARHRTLRRRDRRRAIAQVGRLLAALGPAPALDTRRRRLRPWRGVRRARRNQPQRVRLRHDAARAARRCAGPGIPAGRVVGAPGRPRRRRAHRAALLGLAPFDATGSISRRRSPAPPCRRGTLYAESFAPLLDFGWSPLRARARRALEVHRRTAAELYDVEADPGESVTSRSTTHRRRWRGSASASTDSAATTAADRRAGGPSTATHRPAAGARLRRGRPAVGGRPRRSEGSPRPCRADRSR